MLPKILGTSDENGEVRSPRRVIPDRILPGSSVRLLPMSKEQDREGEDGFGSSAGAANEEDVSVAP